MPVTIPVGSGVASIEMRHASDPQPYYCTLGVSPVTAPLGQPEAQRILAAWGNGIMPHLSNLLTLTSVILRVQNDPGTLVYTAANAVPSAGGAAGPAMPPNVAYLIEKRTSLGGKRGLGRFFVPGVIEGNVTSFGPLEAGVKGVLDGAFSTFLLSLSAPAALGPPAEEPVLPVLFHSSTTTRSVSATPTTRTVVVTTGAAGGPPTQITSFQADPVIATQRRRLR